MKNKRHVLAIPFRVRFTLYTLCVLAMVSTKGIAQSNQKASRQQLDGIAAVIGDYILLDSDIERSYQQLLMQQQAAQQDDSLLPITRCQVAETLYESRLFAHHSKQDSIPFNQAEVDQKIDQQISYMKQQLGGIDKVLAFYNKPTIQSFKKELKEINTINSRSEAMRNHIVSQVEVSPDEIAFFYRNLSEDQIPEVGTTVELAQLVLEPKPSDQEEKRVVDKLNALREDVLYNGMSFATRAVMHSQDPGSSDKGGKYTITRETPFAKEFKDNAFSLQEGEVSRPFQTDFGWHILTVDKIRGREVDVRHILIVPQITTTSLQKAQEKLTLIRDSIANNTLSFKEAVKRYSDQIETKRNDGKLINPQTRGTSFELTKLDPILYSQLEGLQENQISPVIIDQDRQGRKKFKILTILNKTPEHKADFQKDYTKIREIALVQKQQQFLTQWKKDRLKKTYTRFVPRHCQCVYDIPWCENPTYPVVR